MKKSAASSLLANDSSSVASRCVTACRACDQTTSAAASTKVGSARPGVLLLGAPIWVQTGAMATARRGGVLPFVTRAEQRDRDQADRSTRRSSQQRGFVFESNDNTATVLKTNAAPILV